MIHTYLGKTIRFDIHYKNRTSIGIYIDSYGKDGSPSAERDI